MNLKLVLVVSVVSAFSFSIANAMAPAAPIAYPSPVSMTYGTASTRQNLDLYVPSGGGVKPVIVFVHGGGWVLGPGASVKESVFRPNASTSPMYNFLGNVTKMGVAVAIIKYRLPKYSPKAGPVDSAGVKLADMLSDIDLSIAKIKEVAAQYNLDPAKIHILGESAGAHLALMYSYQKSFANQSSVKSVVSFYGPTDLSKEDTFRDYNTYTVGTNIPTIFSMIPGNLFQFSPTNSPDEDANGGVNSIYPMRAFDSAAKIVGLGVEGSLQRKAYSPIQFAVSPSGLPSTLILHGLDDKLVNSNQADVLINALNAQDFSSSSSVSTSVSHHYHLFTAFGHGWAKTGASNLVTAFDQEVWPVVKNWISKKILP